MSTDCIVVAFVSGKGGTGKTTLTANFAIELASSLKTDVSGHREGRKNRVLVIDNDYATGGTSYLLAGGERLKSGEEASVIQPNSCFYNCYAQDIPAEEVAPLGLIFHDPSVGDFEVDVLLNSLSWWRKPVSDTAEEAIPGIADRAKAESFVDHDLLPYYEHLLERFRQSYDFILIDSRGGADTRASVAAVVADAIIIVSEPGEVAAKQDASFVESLHQMAAEINSAIGPIGLIMNRVLTSERGRGVRKEVKVIGRLPFSQRVVECYRGTELIFDRSPADPFCIAALEAYRHWFPHEKGVCQARMKVARRMMNLRDSMIQLQGYLTWFIALLATVIGGTMVYFTLKDGVADRFGLLQPVLTFSGVTGLALLVLLLIRAFSERRLGRRPEI